MLLAKHVANALAGLRFTNDAVVIRLCHNSARNTHGDWQ